MCKCSNKYECYVSEMIFNICLYKALFHYRFSHVHCKSCIVGFIERISEVYESGKRQSSFVLDLIKLDTPNLLLVQSPTKDYPRVDQMFIELVCTFIQKNALCEAILIQVPTIMVSGYWKIFFLCLLLPAFSPISIFALSRYCATQFLQSDVLPSINQVLHA